MLDKFSIVLLYNNVIGFSFSDAIVNKFRQSKK